MLLKVGGGGSHREPGEGIHWHMNIKNRIEYRARDPKRTEVAWVASRSPDGKLTEFTDPEKAASAQDLAALEVRTMDCLDCHNRPAHVFFSPEEAVNRSLAAGLLDPGLPYLKKAAVEALSAGYASLAAADVGIEARLKAFLAEKVPPEIAAGVAPQLPAQAEELQAIYRRNFFPHMGARWAAYPDHIGHREFAGCFRCHDGRRRSPEGKVLSKDCDLCHTFAARSDDGKSMTALPSDGSFLHPWKHERHSQMDCWSCHAGAASPYETCSKCHEPEAGAPMAFACSSCHKPLKVTVENAECAPCHDLTKSKLHAIKDHGDCLACHKQHEWRTVAYPDDCTGACHQDLKKPHHDGEPCSPCHDFRGVTSRLGF